MEKNASTSFFKRHQALIFCTATSIIASLASGHARAEHEDNLRLSGFGTIGYAADNRGDLAAVRDLTQKPKDSYATDGTWLIDSRVGVQLEYRVGQMVDLVGQFVLRDHYNANLSNATELAYGAFRPRPDIDIRVGRISYDAFLMSDHRNVGYAYTWVRPAAEFYSWIPIFSIDGVDAAYNLRGNNVDWRFKIQAGKSRLSIPISSGYEFRADNLLGLSITRQSGPWRLKAAYSRFTIGSEVPGFMPLHQALDQLAASASSMNSEAADLRKNLTFDNAHIGYTTLGAVYDDGVWLVQAELGRTTSTADVVPHGVMAYANVARRFGDWTPYVGVSTSHPGNGRRAAANNWGPYNASVRDVAIYIQNTTRIEQSTVSLGTRWDFSRQAALKLQWDRTAIEPSGYGLWWRNPAINNQGSRVDLVSATLEFTF